MTYTTNYNLKKPGTDDLVDIADLNDNADTIDTALAAKQDTLTAGTGIDITGNVISATGGGGGGGSRLPSAYQEVEYIESDGTGQYIDTGFLPSDNCSATFDFALDLPISAGGVFIGGSRESSGVKQFYFMMQDVSSKTTISVKMSGDNFTHSKQINNTSPSSAVTILPRSKVAIALNGGNYYNDIVCGEQKSGTITAFSSTYSVHLFGINNGGTNSQQTGDIYFYGFKAYTGVTLVRDLIPCYRIADNEIGMYDIVNDVFYTNAGTGTFTKGADV